MSRLCSKKLNEAEAKIEKLTKDKKGELITELFPTENENDEQE
jgi:exodeoxyribonuclease VII small subunit